MFKQLVAGAMAGILFTGTTLSASALAQSTAIPGLTAGAPRPAGTALNPTATAPSPTAAALPAWKVPNPDALPETIFGRTVRRGRDLIAKTSSLIGPDAKDPAMHYAGNGLTCQNCHLQAGTQQFAEPLAGIWGLFPQYMPRENAVRTLEERINGCMERSMNGRPLPLDGPDMKAMLTYIRFVSAPEQVGQPLVGRGTPPLKLPDRAADPKHGAQVYTAMCAMCHGAEGLGQRLTPQDAAAQGKRYSFPPLWGPDSYNDGAGMARVITAARFIHANMPFGATFATPMLSPADAFDVAAYIDSQPRPHKADLQADFPDRSLKPADAAFPPYVAPFPPAQFKFGPWPPIQAWMRAKAAKPLPTQ